MSVTLFILSGVANEKQTFNNYPERPARRRHWLGNKYLTETNKGRQWRLTCFHLKTKRKKGVLIDSPEKQHPSLLFSGKVHLVKIIDWSGVTKWVSRVMLLNAHWWMSKSLQTDLTQQHIPLCSRLKALVRVKRKVRRQIRPEVSAVASGCWTIELCSKFTPHSLRPTSQQPSLWCLMEEPWFRFKIFV